MPNTPLAVLDLVPISSGSSAPEALRNSIDLAQQAERLGYARYWFAEHHLNPGVAGTSPAVVLALTAAATTSIRIGSGAVQMGHRTALSTVEEFGLIDALYPGRLDLGLGRSGGRRGPRNGAAPDSPAAYKTDNGLLIPARFPIERLLRSPRVGLQRTLLTLPNAEPQDYTEQVGDVLALLRGTYVTEDGVEGHIVPGEGADIQVWILGSSGGESARVAGANGLRFAANYHVSPATVLEAADGYRAEFVPSAELGQPYVSVSADVVVAPDEAAARELAAAALATIGGPSGDAAWPWPEDRLTYGNAAIAEALIVAGSALADDPAVDHGLSLLEFLLRVQTRNGRLSVTPAGGRGRPDTGPGFDQQPIEVAALADACASAYRVTLQPRWLTGVRFAWNWFLGDNDSATPMFDPQTGGGYDGLERRGRNLNQGAESTLAMLATAQLARWISESE
jgi:alkanesulfonate monooxygenase SsuD/methylene tetrahydromethanopterin reductase-like flavin-dependent oxidoreductase (luciferase family)